MGLREINAARTKTLLVNTAMELFMQDGYDATTMEDIAAKAGVSTSTLYRYFGTKEAVFVGYLGEPSLAAEALRSRPEHEPVEVAVGHAIIAFYTFATIDLERAAKFNEIARNNARPRGHLNDWLGSVQHHLTEAIAERAGKTLEPIQVAAMSCMAIFVIQYTASLPDENDAANSTQVAAEVMRELARFPLLAPRLDD